jgi:hypothetical protein
MHRLETAWISSRSASEPNPPQWSWVSAASGSSFCVCCFSSQSPHFGRNDPGPKGLDAGLFGRRDVHRLPAEPSMTTRAAARVATAPWEARSLAAALTPNSTITRDATRRLD